MSNYARKELSIKSRKLKDQRFIEYVKNNLEISPLIEDAL
jgi:hypothetical protein